MTMGAFSIEVKVKILDADFLRQIVFLHSWKIDTTQSPDHHRLPCTRFTKYNKDNCFFFVLNPLSDNHLLLVVRT